MYSQMRCLYHHLFENLLISNTVDTSRGTSSQVTEGKGEAPFDPLIVKEGYPEKLNEERRKIAGWNITSVCLGILLLISSASAENFPR
ncbi:hypothetical protein ACHQM5_013167 [Ranunculus cassubicifolius]